jgi:hypothetical protein
MSTLKYRASDRYEMGWTDPRATLKDIKVNQKRLTGLEDVPTEVLRNLWDVRFGIRAVASEDMYDIRAEDIADVVQELSDRGFVEHRIGQRMAPAEPLNHYILRDKPHANR